jgi:hypothetical protein
VGSLSEKNKLLIGVAVVITIIIYSTVLIRQGSETPETESVPALMESRDLHDLFLSDFPQLENAEIVNSWQAESEDGRGLSVLLETRDSVSQVAGFYKRELEAGGWEVKVIEEGSGSVLLSFTKNSYFGPLGITKSASGSTLISVTIGIN